MRRLRNMVHVALVIGASLAPGGAWAQNTTTSSSTTSTSSTVTSTTSTTVADRCAGQPCTDLPPGLVLSTPTAQIEADRPGFCWRRPGEPGGFCVTASFVPGYKPPLLVVTEGEVVTLRFTPPVPGTPQQVSLADNGVLAPLTAANPTSFRVDLPAGVHEGLSIVTRWLQGEVGYLFRLDVRRPTVPAVPSDGRVIALTG